ncbi:MAG: ribonuclease Y [Acetilactobacillus jinshanensis]
MFTAGIIVVMAALGYSGGMAINRKSNQHRLAQARQHAQAYIKSHQQADVDRKRVILKKDRLNNQKHRQNSEAELNNQKHDNLELADRLHDHSHYLDKSNARLDKLARAFKVRQKKYDQLNDHYQATTDQAEALVKKCHQKLSQISQIDDQTAKTTVLNATKLELKREKDIFVKFEAEDAANTADQRAADVIIEAIQRGPIDLPRNHIERSINVPDPIIKRRLLERNAQHLRLVESVTGTDLFFDQDDPLLLHIATNDPIRRETARRTLSNLIVSRHMTDTNIEVQVRNAEDEVDNELREIGENVVNEMHLGWMHPDLMKIVGRLKFRTSYGQNVLYHSMEVGQMSGVMAAELGLNTRLARRAGLLHDVGKSIDHEVTGTHVELGVKLAKTYGENPIVVNAIAAHHGDVPPTNLISLLVSTSDALSGARPGARSESIEEYLQRLKNLENIANQQDGVKESYAIQAGRELRIIIDPRAMNDEQSAELTKHVRDRIQKELSYPGKIKITTIRMLKAIQYVGNWHRHYHHYHENRRA